MNIHNYSVITEDFFYLMAFICNEHNTIQT